MNIDPSIMKQICSLGSSKNTFWEWFWLFFEMIEWEKWWWWSDFNPVSYSIKGLKVLNFAVLISYWTICDKVIPMKGGQHERGKHVARFKIKVRTSCQLNHQPITQKNIASTDLSDFNTIDWKTWKWTSILWSDCVRCHCDLSEIMKNKWNNGAQPGQWKSMGERSQAKCRISTQPCHSIILESLLCPRGSDEILPEVVWAEVPCEEPSTWGWKQQCQLGCGPGFNVSSIKVYYLW